MPVQASSPWEQTVIATTKDYKVFYRFYPGADAINDFNLESNHVYNVGLTLKGIGNNDDRVASQTAESLPGANCYMTAPGSILTFNPYAAAGIDVSSTGWTYAGRMGTNSLPLPPNNPLSRYANSIVFYYSRHTLQPMHFLRDR